MADFFKRWPDLDLTEVRDPDGHSVRTYRVQGTNIYLPPFPDVCEIFRELPNVEARSDDILICGYPKCGTHWVWEVAGMLSRGQAEYIPAIKETVMVEAVDGASLSSLPSPRILNSHLSPAFIPGSFMEKRSRIIYLLRNPKDMLVSLYNHTYNLLPFYGYDGSWKGYFELFMQSKVDYGDWFSYVKVWDELIESRADLPVHVIYYEHMKQSPESEIRRLAGFLGTADHPELIRQIAEKCSFHKMKVAKSAFDDEREKADWREGKPLMYRKGEVGDWKNWFTVSQNERFDDKIKRKLPGCKHNFTFVL